MATRTRRVYTTFTDSLQSNIEKGSSPYLHNYHRVHFTSASTLSLQLVLPLMPGTSHSLRFTTPAKVVTTVQDTCDARFYLTACGHMFWNSCSLMERGFEVWNTGPLPDIFFVELGICKFRVARFVCNSNRGMIDVLARCSEYVAGC